MAFLLNSSTFAQTPPNDPLFKKQWGLNDSVINWKQAQAILEQEFPANYKPDNNSPVIVVIDTGFKHHEDLSPQHYLYGQNTYIIRYDWQSFQYSIEKNIMNECFDRHGNASLGILGATPNNGIGLVGTSLGLAKILAIDTHYTDKNGVNTPYMDGDAINKVLEFILEQKKTANIIAVNMSFASTKDDLTENILKLEKKGIIVVAAAGNKNADISAQPYFPAASGAPNVISVAELDHTRTLSRSSNFGGNINIGAPGQGMPSFGLENNYISGNGSSASAPFVSGVIAAGAALYDRKRTEGYVYADLTAAQLINMLYDSASTDEDLAGSIQNGRIINAGKFMETILACRSEAIKSQRSCSVSQAFPDRGMITPGVRPPTRLSKDTQLYMSLIILLAGTWIFIRYKRQRKLHKTLLLKTDNLDKNRSKP